MRQKYHINWRRESRGITEMRQSGLPWLVAAVSTGILAIAAFIVILLLSRIPNGNSSIEKHSEFSEKELTEVTISQEDEQEFDFLNEDSVEWTDDDNSGEDDYNELMEYTERKEDENNEERMIIAELEEGSAEINGQEKETQQQTEFNENESPPVNGPQVNSPTKRWWKELRGKEVQSVSYSSFAVTSDNQLCSVIGRDILNRGGNAVDAAIAVHFCVGGLEPQLTGLGAAAIAVTCKGGSIDDCITVDGSFVTPQSASENTFRNDPIARETGITSTAIPGVLHTLWTLYRSRGSGRILWIDLISPTISLLLNGYPVSSDLSNSLRDIQMRIAGDETMRKAFLNSDGNLMSEGEIRTDFQLADTFRKLATSRDPVQMFYRGDIANQLIKEMKDNGGFLQKSDLVNFVSQSEVPRSNQFNNFTVMVPGPPSMAAVSAVIAKIANNDWHNLPIMSILEAIETNASSTESAGFFYHIILEAQKHSFPLAQVLGDPKFFPESLDETRKWDREEFIRKIANRINEYVKVPDYYGKPIEQPKVNVLSHINVVDKDGTVIALSSGLNSRFGSVVRSSKLGFMWNNGLSSFPIHESRGIEPKKRPPTTMTPIVIYSDKHITPMGAVGGSLSSLASIAQLITAQSVLNSTTEEALSLPRVWGTAHSGTFFELSLPFKSASDISSHGQQLSPSSKIGSSISAIQVDRKAPENGRSEVNSVKPICDNRSTMCFLAGG